MPPDTPYGAAIDEKLASLMDPKNHPRGADGKVAVRWGALGDFEKQRERWETQALSMFHAPVRSAGFERWCWRP